MSSSREISKQSVKLKGDRGRAHRRRLSVCKSARVSVSGFLLLAGCLLSLSSSPAACGQADSYTPKTTQREQAVEEARQAVQAAPQDARARFDLGKALRMNGQPEAAAGEYLEATALDPALYVAYHELSLTKTTPQQLDEAIDRLKVLKDERPKDLMLRVGLSELLEKRGDTYQAARTLIDLVFANGVPERYVNKVNSRIHYLLSKAKETHQDNSVKSQAEVAATEDTLAPALPGARLGGKTDDAAGEDTLQPPLPDASLKRNLSASKVKPTKVMQNFGHAPLVP
ncbi:MAG TPA: hypothetical protein V6C72_05035 [Chroococcales cyanobacterium]